MQRRRSALVIVLATTMTLTGCGQVTAATGPTVLTLQVPDDPAAEAYRDLVGEYDRANPGVRVVVRTVAAPQARAELFAELGQSGLSDLVTVNGEWLPELAAYSDLLAAVPAATLGGADAPRWPDWVVADATDPGGRVIGYASGIAPQGVCYRPDLLAEAGLPTDPADVRALVRGDWTEILAVAATYTAATGRAFFDSAESVYDAMIDQLAAPYEEPGTGVVVAAANPAVRTAFDRLTADPAVFAGIEPGTPEWTAAATDGAFAASLCAGGTTTAVTAATTGTDGGAGDGDGTLAALRDRGWQIADVFPAGGGSAGTTYFAIPSAGAHVALAAALADWITAPEQQATLYARAGVFPAAAELLPAPGEAQQDGTDPEAGTATGDPAPADDGALGGAETPTAAATDAAASVFATPLSRLLAERAAAVTVSRFRGPATPAIDEAMHAALESVRTGAADPDAAWAAWIAAVPTT